MPRPLRLLLAVVLITAAGHGCASEPAPLPPAVRDDVERQYRLAERGEHLLESGQIHAGQPVEEMLRLCKPYRIDFIDRYTFIEFMAVGTPGGLSLVAVDDSLVKATRWYCDGPKHYFNTMTSDDEPRAYDAYGPRVWGDRW